MTQSQFKNLNLSLDNKREAIATRFQILCESTGLSALYHIQHMISGFLPQPMNFRGLCLVTFCHASRL